MITETTFFGLPLRTPAQRRLLVVLYYAILLLVTGIASFRRNRFPPYLGIQTFILAGLLGGIRGGGPVKPYSQPGGQDAPPLSLGLSPTRIPGAWTPLDERETERRNWAHFRAYRILIALFGATALTSLVAWNFAAGPLTHAAPLLLWLLLVVTLSLPQAVLLWTEPEDLDSAHPAS